MTNKRTLPIILAILSTAIILAFAGGVLAQDEMEMASFTISATEEGILAPEMVDAGPVEITFENSTEIPFYSIIGRLDEGVSMEEFMGALMAVFTGDPSAVPPATFLGSPMALPGETQAAMYNLEAGMYIVLSVAGDEPVMTTFVVEGEMAEEMEIEVDLTVGLADFVFGLPDELTSGEQIWQINNVGEQWHEMVFMQLPDGATMEDAMMMMMPPEAEAAEGEAEAAAEGEAEAAEGEEAPEGGEGGPSMDGISFLWSPMSAGTNGLTKINLEPGTYLVICFIPDSTSEEGLSHAEQGMIQIVTVLDAE